MKQESNLGFGFLGLLQIILIRLKIVNLINWSWWSVFIPFFATIGAFILFSVIILIVSLFEERE